MVRYLVQHRRGTSSQIANATRPIEEGEIVIEYSNDYSRARLLIGTKNGYDAMDFSAVSKIRTVSLPASAWLGENAPYYQVFEVGAIGGITENSKIDLQPSVEILNYLQREKIMLTSENDNGVVTFYAFGWKPTIDMQIQVTISEVTT
jgi:hypothetical protein